MLYPALT